MIKNKKLVPLWESVRAPLDGRMCQAVISRLSPAPRWQTHTKHLIKILIVFAKQTKRAKGDDQKRRSRMREKEKKEES